MTQKLACIILAAGKGSRMKSNLPKPLHAVAGLPMVNHIINTAEELSPEKIVVVIGNDMVEMEAAVKPHTTVIQQVANGTGGAALTAREELEDFDGDILIVFGDTPLITSQTLQKMIDSRRQLPATGLTFSGLRPDNPSTYGRMIMDDDGTLKKIVEFKDASVEEKKITLCNGGIVCADGTKLFDWLSQITNDNAQNEYYLTDLPQIARKDNRQTIVVEVPEDDVAGVNDRQQLARMEQKMQQRLRDKHMTNGATLIDPDTVFFSYDTIIGQDVMIEPNVVFGSGVKVDNNVTIHAFSHIIGAKIASGADIGPFARLRPGAHIGKNAKVGNFVEIKNSTLAAGVKAGHLTYLGDAEIGENVNIGAGTITCNYDGFLKYKTTIGRDSFIGTNSSLIAPVNIGSNSYVGASSAIYEDVEDGALALTRAPQIEKQGWTADFRRKKMKEKAGKK